MRKFLTVWLAAASLALFALAAIALPAQAQPLAAGSDYAAIEPALPSDNPGKIEVTEFFSYGCPHCYDLHPLLVKWTARQPADVVVRRVPAGWNPFYQLMARLYYTLEATGELKRLDEAAFQAIHVKGLKLIDEKSILEWAVSQGVDAKKFSDAFNSFGVVSKVKRGDQLLQSAKIRSVPALMVDGRYLVVGQNVKSQADLLALTDRVIDKARSERRTQKN